MNSFILPDYLLYCTEKEKNEKGTVTISWVQLPVTYRRHYLVAAIGVPHLLQSLDPLFWYAPWALGLGVVVFIILAG